VRSPHSILSGSKAGFFVIDGRGGFEALRSPHNILSGSEAGFFVIDGRGGFVALRSPRYILLRSPLGVFVLRMGVVGGGHRCVVAGGPVHRLLRLVEKTDLLRVRGRPLGALRVIITP
jgi:hypothetical protein